MDWMVERLRSTLLNRQWFQTKKKKKETGIVSIIVKKWRIIFSPLICCQYALPFTFPLAGGLKLSEDFRTCGVVRFLWEGGREKTFKPW